MSPKSDVWSVGCVLYELITKKVPWIGRDIQAIYYTVRNFNQSDFRLKGVKIILVSQNRLGEGPEK